MLHECFQVPFEKRDWWKRVRFLGVTWRKAGEVLLEVAEKEENQ